MKPRTAAPGNLRRLEGSGGGRHGVRGEHILDDKAGGGRCGEIWKVPAPKTLLHNPGGHVYPHTSPNRLSSILAQLFLHPF